MLSFYATRQPGGTNVREATPLTTPTRLARAGAAGGVGFVVAVLLLSANSAVCLADWPQYMHNSANTGYTDEQIDPASLGLVAQVLLDDAVLSSPIVVGDRCYVVDQMGTAYAIEVESGEIAWQSSPEGTGTFGGNTSTPVHVDGVLVYGTIAGNLHWLRASDGERIRTIELGYPIVSAVTESEGRIYASTVASEVHAFDVDGTKRWTWDHHELGRRWAANTLDQAEDPAHFSGAPVSLVGDRVIAPLGYDLVCLRDAGDGAERLWQVSRPRTRFDVALGASVEGDYVYAAWPKSDGQGTVVRHRLSDGSHDQAGILRGQWAVYTPPAVSRERAFTSRHAFGVSRIDFSADEPPREIWRGFAMTKAQVQPVIAAVALTPDHVVSTTLYGELRIMPVDTGWKAIDLERPAPVAYRYTTPSGAMISSEPAISGGRIFFGSDDGCLYILGPGGAAEARDLQHRVVQRRDHAGAAATDGRPYEWPSTFGGLQNTNYVDDPQVRPPFRLRWAARSYGDFKHPVIGADQELLSVSLAGMVVCREQASGRIRWRQKLPGQAWSRASLTAVDGKVLVPRVGSPRYAFVTDQPDALYCLDQATGELLWKNRIGRGDWLRASPLFVDGIVAYGSKYETPRGAEYVVGPADPWKVAQGDVQGQWIEASFDDSEWSERLFSGGGRRSDTSIRPGELWHLRHTFTLSAGRVRQIGAGEKQLGFVVGPHDAILAHINGTEVLRTKTWGEQQIDSRRYNGEAARYMPLAIDADQLAGDSHVLAVAVRRARVRSNVSSSTSVFPPRLVIVPPGAMTGPVAEAWDAVTGQPLWQIAFDAAGDYIEGPAGASHEGLMYFTGGGGGTNDSRGETLAIEPHTGEILWRNTNFYASRTATPSVSDGRLILPGSHRQPLASLNLENGEMLWTQDAWTHLAFVHAASVGAGLFTVNTKYRGGAVAHDLTTGKRLVADGDQIDLAGRGHTCGTIVLLKAGYAVAATNRGIFITDTSTGEVVHETPGFASQACPHPAFANGRMFYAPQDNNTIYCFEPVPPQD